MQLFHTNAIYSVPHLQHITPLHYVTYKQLYHRAGSSLQMRMLRSGSVALFVEEKLNE